MNRSPQRKDISKSAKPSVERWGADLVRTFKQDLDVSALRFSMDWQTSDHIRRLEQDLDRIRLSFLAGKWQIGACPNP